MTEAMAEQARRLSYPVYGLIAVLVFLGDQLTKHLVEASLPPQAVIPVVPGWFNLTHVKNAGAAFGLLADSPSSLKTALLVVSSLLMLGFIVLLVLRSRHLYWAGGVGLSLVLGGALSNLLDRVRFGRVVDFLDFAFRQHHWPAFNLADGAIVVGAGFLLLQILYTE